ncbi:transcriptional regulator, AlpA family [Paraburkholderia caballeronis]|nr:transcriptional regulator, AlpA family [Paraburkholderia caballeronis]
MRGTLLEVLKMTDGSKGVLRLPGVKALTGLGRSSIYAKGDPRSPQYDSQFPRPIALGGRARGWLVEELETWLANRPRGSNAARTTTQRKGGERG